MKYPFVNIVCEGGGVKGAAYVGVRQVLEERGILPNIKRVAGTSAGAINAVLMALDYSQEDTREIVMGLDFSSLMDDSFGVFRDLHRLVHKFGWYKEDIFMDWMGDIIARKAGHNMVTFSALKSAGFKDLYLIGANLSTGYSEIFSAEHTPDMPVLAAVRISMSIPLFFEAVIYHEDIYVDGGLFRNYPIRLFDRQRYIEHGSSNKHVYNSETLGFRLDSKEQISTFRGGVAITHKQITDFGDYTKALVAALMNVQDSMHLHSEDWRRTVYIDTQGVGAVDFDLDNETKEKLVEAGIKGTEMYLDQYSQSFQKERKQDVQAAAG